MVMSDSGTDCIMAFTSSDFPGWDCGAPPGAVHGYKQNDFDTAVRADRTDMGEGDNVPDDLDKVVPGHASILPESEYCSATAKAPDSLARALWLVPVQGSGTSAIIACVNTHHWGKMPHRELRFYE